MLTETLPRIRMAQLPTPIEPLDRLSAHLSGPRLLIKRDDQTGLATGGNKARKLEFLVGEALAAGADVLVTGGAAQSNHARQTAAAASRVGLRSVLVLKGQEPSSRSGNLLLDDLLGAEIRWCGNRDLGAALQGTAEDLWHSGARPALIPYGGSSPVGAAGYVAAMEELVVQLDAMDEQVTSIVFASSSGGTQAGLVLGARCCGYTGRILGISVDRLSAELAGHVAELATETAALLGKPYTFLPEDIQVNDDYLGGGYAIVGDPEREAIRLFARVEGLLLDPVYTGRAAAGLIDLAGKGCFAKGETVLFWHTGGTAGLFAFAPELLGP